jgi:hypothetical protein
MKVFLAPFDKRPVQVLLSTADVQVSEVFKSVRPSGYE